VVKDHCSLWKNEKLKVEPTPVEKSAVGQVAFGMKLAAKGYKIVTRMSVIDWEAMSNA